MLIEFNVTNFRSIKSQQSFNLSRSKLKESKTLNENSFEPSELNNLGLLRSSVIYGPNAAGKSNLLLALRTMKVVVEDSATEMQRGDLLPITPFKLDPESATAPSVFEAVFISKGIRYQYGFAATAERIIEEWLIAYPKVRAQHWFARLWLEKTNEYQWEMGNALQGQKQLWQESTRSNALFLSTAVQLNSQQLQPVYDWFNDILRSTSMTGLSPAFTASVCTKAEDKVKVLSFLKAADLDIQDIVIKKKVFDPDDLDDDLPDEIKSIVINKMEGKEIVDELNMVHRDSTGNPVPFDLNEESDGTQKLFSCAGPWLDTLENGYVLIIDELHAHLHPKLVRFLVELFHSNETNPNNAQLIFTTHDTSILHQEVFRRDQVWFCDKGDDQETSVFPLTDFSPRKGRENLELSYLSGRFGALPYVGKLKTA